MRDKRGQLLSNIIFGVSVFCLVFGTLVLLATLKGVPRTKPIPSTGFIGLGLFLGGLAVSRDKGRQTPRRSLLLFFSCFFLLAGFFFALELIELLPFHWTEFWPLLSVFAGLSLIPAGCQRYGRLRAIFFFPAVVFAALGCFLLFFSLDIVPFSFRQFMVDWWPLFLALFGIVLALVSLSRREK
jgi:hypothetical protein